MATTGPDIGRQVRSTLERLGAASSLSSTGSLEARSPIDGRAIGQVDEASPGEVDAAAARAARAFEAWRRVPAPRRGELVRLLGEELRRHKAELGLLVTLEAGKIVSEGLGEVQEMIDICDFAVGLSRQLYGLTIATERPGHRMMETWHPLGPVGVITAFNFPVAVWSWNAALALVCGDPVLWKPSERTPLTALAVQALFERAAERFGDAPPGLSQVLVGGREVGEALVDDARVPLVSATGSTAMGRVVGERLARRFGRALLELGGNNAAIVCPSADLDLTLRAVAEAEACGGRLHGGERVLEEIWPDARYVRPALAEMPAQVPVMLRETFAPLLYVVKTHDLDEAIALQNGVPQGLASSIFTQDLGEAERFLASSDCGIANVNIGPSGAEIGGAFGGEKETGGGREAGSDSWRAYMRRATNTINYSRELPLAQGVKFAVEG